MIKIRLNEENLTKYFDYATKKLKIRIKRAFLRNGYDI